MQKKFVIHERDQLKGKKLEYLYLIPEEEHSLYPLLGSVWRYLGYLQTRPKDAGPLIIISSDQNYSQFNGFIQSIKDSSQVKLIHENELNFKKLSNTPHGLVVVDRLSNESIPSELRNSSLIGRKHFIVAGNDPHIDDYDLVSEFKETQYNSQGVYSYTGNGKGKSSSAFGHLASAIIEGRSVGVVQWFKDASWGVSEHSTITALANPNLVNWEATGAGFFGGGHMDKEKEAKIHQEKAKAGLDIAAKMITSRKYFVVVLDELVDTVNLIAQNMPQTLIELDIVRDLLNLAKENLATEIIVTGRRVTKHWKDMIKAGTEVVLIRHPFSPAPGSGRKQKYAVKGLDY